MEDVVIPKHTVIQYVRNKKRIPCGVIVAVKREGGFGVGFSLCNKKDKFSKKMALKVALGRSRFFGDGRTEMGGEFPQTISRIIPAFLERCKKYYKVA